MKNLYRIAPRLVHYSLIAFTLSAHVQLAQQSFLSVLRRGKAAAFATDAILASPQILAQLARPILSSIAAYALFFWLIAVLARPRRAVEQTTSRHILILLLTWFSSWWLLLHAHSVWFPRSIWSAITAAAFSSPLTGITTMLAALWIVLRLVALIRGQAGSLHAGLRRLDRRIVVALVILVIALPLSAWSLQAKWSSDAPLHVGSGSGSAQPNLIIIGLDSLRRDLALGDGGEMPHLARVREHAFIEANVVSPIARTFPAWVTLLTGQDPAQSGARFNLTAQDGLPLHESLGWKLKALGYQTIYATDETRFSNIGTEFGFDTVIGPHPGVADFLLAQVADMPLVNFMIQLPWAEQFAPSLVGNRAFASAYRPERYLQRLEHTLGAWNGKPTALAIHLCLAHWPYHTAHTPLARNPDPTSIYRASTRELDAQFGTLLQDLRRLGYLNDRSLLVVLADHGDIVNADEASPASITQVGTDTSPPIGIRLVGHGTSVLVPEQWQVFLMFSGQSALGPVPSGRSDALTSLQDFSGSVLALLGADADRGALAVVDAVRGSAPGSTVVRDTVALETDFRPKSLDLTRPDGAAVLRIASSSYRIGADGRIAMRDDFFDETVKTKDFGVTDGRRTLAVVQTENEPVLVAADEHRRWTVYPTARPREADVDPPLLAQACRNTGMRTHLRGWCGD